MDYIDRIKKLKSQKKITNERLSELTGIPLGTLSKILAGISDSPKLANIIAISEALGCSLDYLVNGTPDNDNNFKLTSDEMAFVEKFRSLDACGKDIALYVVDREYARISCAPETAAQESRSESASRVKRSASAVQHGSFGAPIVNPSAAALKVPVGFASSAPANRRRTVMLYNLPVSAGVGVYLDDTAAEKINIPDNDKTCTADFALRISGNSMEPKYHEGDLLLVENCESVDVGELGIFVLDGNGYFKKYGGDRLISLNPDYGDILLKDYSEVTCCGRVIGKLKRK